MAVFSGTAGNDTANAGTGTLTGFTGGSLAELQDAIGDVFRGAAGTDTIVAGAGNDFIQVAGSDDTAGETYDGGSGSDTIQVFGAGPDVFNFRDDTVAGIESLNFSVDLGGGAEVQLNAPQFSMTSIIAGVHAGQTVRLSLFMDTATNLDLSGVTFTGFTEPGDGVTITGDGDSENITGSNINDTINGNDGNDTILGGLGDDSLDGGAGTDLVDYFNATGPVSVDLSTGTASGAAGNDTLSGFENIRGSNNGAFADVLIGDSGTNVITGLAGNDTITGGDGADTISGGSGNDIIVAGGSSLGDGIDTVNAGPGDDQITGGYFVDILNGDAGNDTFFINNDDFGDTIDGGTDTDTLDLSGVNAGGGWTVDLSSMSYNDSYPNPGGPYTITNVENVIGTNFADTITGDALANALTGGGGNDIISGGDGVDTINGGDGDDQLTGGFQVDIINGGAGNDTFFINGNDFSDNLDGGAGIDVLDLSGYTISSGFSIIDLGTGTYTQVGGVGSQTIVDVENVIGTDFNDVLVGSSGVNVLNGGSGNDEMGGGAGDDTLIGGDATDVLVGGAGADDLQGGAGFDIAFYLGSSAGVTIDLAAGTGLGGEAQGDTFDSVETIIGSTFDDTIIGSTAANTLIGRDGADTFFGSAGGDILIGGDSVAVDTSTSDLVDYTGAATTAEIAVNLANNVAQGLDIGSDQLFGIEDVNGTNFGDLLRGDAMANDLTGLGGGDLMLGGAGNDGLDGGGGDDFMTGEAGNDTFVYNFNDGATGNDIIIDFDQNGNDSLLFLNFGPGFDFTDFTLTTVNVNDVLITASGWNGSAVLQDALGLVDAGDFTFA